MSNGVHGWLLRTAVAMAALVLCWLLTSNPEEATFDFSPEAARCA